MSEDCQYERYALNTESGFNMDHHKVQRESCVPYYDYYGHKLLISESEYY